jgi:DNA (cytosine-5)-methyltransferase 1
MGETDNGREIRFVDLFSGIGGFRIAAERLGWRCVAFSEIDKWALRTYKENFDTSGEVELGDITRVDTKSIPDFDVLLAGFPCQPFSIMGNRLGFEDTRGTLFFDILRILRDKRPRAFVLENVKGLVNNRRGETFWTILKSLSRTINNQLPLQRYRDSLNYNVFWKILNSKDFGVPQNRERVYIVGFRDRVVGFRFPRGHGARLVIRDILEENVDKSFFLNPMQVGRVFKYKMEAGRVSPTLTGSYGRYGKNAFCVRVVMKSDRYSSEVIVDSGGLSPTIKARGENSPPRIYPEMRWLTPRECARLQGFPDTFKIVAPKSKAYEEFGNTVTVPVVEAILREVEKWIR